MSLRWAVVAQRRQTAIRRLAAAGRLTSIPTPQTTSLRLSLVASDEEVASRLIAMAQDYIAKAQAANDASEPPPPEMIPLASSESEPNQC
jgi:hypothetical protein